MANDWVLYFQIGCVVLGSAIGIQLFIQLVVYPFFHPLSKFPGSYWASTSRLWMAYEFWRGTELETLKSLHDKYGKWYHAIASRLQP